MTLALLQIKLEKTDKIRKCKIISRKITLGKCVFIFKCIQAAIFYTMIRNLVTDLSHVPLSRDFSHAAFYDRLNLCVSILDKISERSKYASYFSYCRKVIRAYQDSWDNRCRLLFCCMGNSDRNRVSNMKKLINKEDILRKINIFTFNIEIESIIKINFLFKDKEELKRNLV